METIPAMLAMLGTQLFIHTQTGTAAGTGRNAGGVACNSLGCQPLVPLAIPFPLPGLRTGNCKRMESNEFCRLCPRQTRHASNVSVGSTVPVFANHHYTHG